MRVSLVFVCLLAVFSSAYAREPLRYLKRQLNPEERPPLFASLEETAERRRRTEPGYEAVRGGGDIVTQDEQGKNVETTNRGFYDPHNHYTGILDYRSIGLTLQFAKYDVDFPASHDKTPRKKGEDSILKAAIVTLLKDIKAGVDEANKQLKSQYDVFDPSHPILYVHQYLSTGFLAGVNLNGEEFQSQQAVATGAKAVKKTFASEPLIAAKQKLEAFKALLYEEMLVWGQRVYNQMLEKIKASESAEDKEKVWLSSWAGGDARRTTHGSWTHLGLVKCMTTIEQKDFGNIDVIKNLLDQSLTASASVDFDSSYAIRGWYEDAAKNTNPTAAGDATDLYARLVIQQLIDSNIRYVELSQPFGKVPIPSTAGTDPDILAVIKGGTAGTRLYQIFNDDKVRSKIRIRWLPMFYQKRLAQTEAGTNKFLFQWVKKEDKKQDWVSQEQEAPELGGLWTDPKQDKAFKWLLQFPDVVGVDYASPEVGIFDFTKAKAGLASFIKDAKTIADECKGAKPAKRCVMHIHSGEGYPMYNFHAYFKTKVAQGLIAAPNSGMTRFVIVSGDPDMGFKGSKEFDAFCNNAKKSYQEASKSPVVKLVMIKNNQGQPSQPLHFEGGRQNILGIIGGMKELTKEKNKDDYFGTKDASPVVLFRLGHATHLTYDMAKEMRKYDLMVDNNYQSNLATAALGWNSYHARASKAFKDENTGDLLTMGDNLLKQFAVGASDRDESFNQQMALYFNGIGLYAAFFAGVQVMPGSDGAGSENSDIHEGYMIAQTLLSSFVSKCKKDGDKPYNSVQLTELCSAWMKDDKSPIKKDITDKGLLDTLLNYQRFYARYMFGYDCNAGGNRKCKLLKPWDNNPTEARDKDLTWRA